MRTLLAEVAQWKVDTIHGCFETVTGRFGLSLGQLAQPVRVAMTGGTSSPGIFEVLDVLGRERTIERLDATVQRIGEGSGSALGAGS